MCDYLLQAVRLDVGKLTFGCIMTREILRTSLLLLAATPLHAQLRPLDPIDYRAFDDASVQADAGVAYYTHQHAALAGTRGPLWELGNFHVHIRTGRMVMELGGTVQRLFHDDEIIDPPVGDAAGPSFTRKRHDAGDYRVGSILRLTSLQSATLATLRFGTRLPTTDNVVGLDRDATDFYATLSARRRFSKVAASVEAGLAINGTRKTTYEQTDVLSYAVSLMLPLSSASVFVQAVGLDDLHDKEAIRGNEDLGELRVGAHLGKKQWASITLVKGYREYSPKFGFQVAGRTTFN